MSGIIGLFQRDGRPVAPDTFAEMMEPMAYWGPDGRQSWIKGPVALGQLLRVNTPEARYETLPLTDESGTCTLVCTARLDNREDLCSALEVPYSERTTTPDGALILWAYLKWGEECPDRLEGDWSFAVWDARRRSLFLARDPHGKCGLYWYETPSQFAFASSLKGLLALPGIPFAPNLERLARYLTRSIPDEQTFYKGIYRLPPAHQIRITAEGIERKRYWRLEDAPDVHLASDEAYIEALLDIFGHAVRGCLRSDKPIAVALSGGLDSGSVCALAARELANTGQSLTALTSVPLYPLDEHDSRGNYVDETFLARKIAQESGISKHILIQSEGLTPLEGIKRALWLQEEPLNALNNRYWVLSLLDEAQSRGCGTLLTGQIGNGTVSYRLPAIFWRRTEGTGARLARIYSQMGILGILRKVIHRPAEHTFKRAVSYQQPEPDWMSYSPIRQQFLDQLGIRDRLKEEIYQRLMRVPTDSREDRVQMLQPGRSFLSETWDHTGAAYELDVRDPTCNRRLMEFCLGVPDNQYWRTGQDRWLMRRAMTGILPEEGRLNRRLGVQAADLCQRVLQQKDEVEELLTECEHSTQSLELLDVERMRTAFRHVQEKATSESNLECGRVLFRGLLVHLFLQRFRSEVDLTS